MKILVIGGAGYTGSVLVEELIACGYSVRVLDRLFYGEDGLKNLRGKIELVVADMRRIDETILENVEAVINVGGLSNDPTAEYNPRANYEMNTLATEQSALLSKKHGIKRYIFASSCSLYDSGVVDSDANPLATEETQVSPLAAYSLSKYEGERRLLQLSDNNFAAMILRKGTVFGFSPRMRYDLVVNTFVKDALSKGIITVLGGGEMWRPLISVKDVARFYIKCLQAPIEQIRGQIFNLVYKNFRISELALRVKEVLKEIGINVEIYTDYQFLKIRNYRVSGTKITEVLGICPQVSVEDAVKEMVQKIKANGYTDFENHKYYNIRWIKLLEEASNIIKMPGSVLDLPA